MTERSIEDLLKGLSRAVEPNHAFEERLRQRLTQELRAAGGDTVAAGRNQGVLPTADVVDLQAKATTTIGTKRAPSRRLQAAAAAVVLAVGVAVTVVATQGDDSSVTVTAPDATFVGARLEAISIDAGQGSPYFVAAHGDTWVLSLAGSLFRVGDSGEPVHVATVPEASLIAAGDDALWIAEAVDGRVLRVDPTDGSVVAEIETSIEVMPSIIRIPSQEGTSRQFALIGGIVSNGESVWVGDRAGQVLRIDPETNAIADSFDVPVRPDQLQLDGDNLLVVNRSGHEAVVVDSSSGEVLHPVERLDQLAGAAIHDGALYLQDAAVGTVTRIDLDSGARRTSQPLGPSVDVVGQPVLPTGLVVSAAAVLAYTDAEPASLHVLDPDTLVETAAIEVEPGHGDMTVAPDGSVWLVRAGARTLLHIIPRPL